MADIISEQLDQLQCQEEGSEINFISLSSFLHFLELVSDTVKSDLIISLTPDNEIYATWKGSKKHCLRFLQNGDIKYFVM